MMASDRQFSFDSLLLTSYSWLLAPSFLLLAIALCFTFLLAPSAVANTVQTGLDCVADYAVLLRGQRVGVLANQTSQDRHGRFIVEVLADLNNVTVSALFAPEHGLWGTVRAGGEVKTVLHPDYGIPVYSFYGPDEKPMPPNLETVDVLVFDMQDIGTRFYTYVSTMALAMRAAAQEDKAFIVLDRPNPLGGRRVEGPILDPNFASFKGLFPIPVVHGMTVGELAAMINGKDWLGKDTWVDLHVVPMQNWSRDMRFDQTKLRFVKPSPNIPDVATIGFYPCTALIEGTNVSEGRGTDRPFAQLGAPWIDGTELADRLNALNMRGVRFIAVRFTPQNSKHAGVECHGVRLEVSGPDVFSPFVCGVRILKTLYQLYPEQLVWRLPHLDELCGTDTVRNALEGQDSLEALFERWRAENKIFRNKATAYYLYP